jgi:DNA-binding winged helix-turn-helix (wHTH) protein
MFMTETTKTAMSQSGEHKVRAGSVALVVSEEMTSVPAGKIAHEFRKMSRFVPVVVLIPKSAVIGKTDQNDINIKRLPDGLIATVDAPAPVPAVKEGLPDPNSADTLVFGDVTVSVSSMETHRRGKLVPLTCKEFKILVYFIKNRRRVISRDEFLNEVWGYQSYPCTRTVDNHIWQLRRKLETDPTNPKHFYTVHGAGYRFVP